MSSFFLKVTASLAVIVLLLFLAYSVFGLRSYVDNKVADSILENAYISAKIVNMSSFPSYSELDPNYFENPLNYINSTVNYNSSGLIINWSGSSANVNYTNLAFTNQSNQFTGSQNISLITFPNNALIYNDSEGIVTNKNLSFLSASLSFIKNVRGISSISSSSFFFDLTGSSRFFFRNGSGNTLLEVSEQEGISIFKNIQTNGYDILLEGATSDILSTVDLDLYPNSQTTYALRVSNSTTALVLQALGTSTFSFADNIDASTFNITAGKFIGDGSLLTNLPVSSYNDIWINNTFYNKTQSDSRYLQSYTETDPLWTSNFTAYNSSWSLDTNETTRFNALVDTDCSGTDKVIGIQSNGTVLCGADQNTGEASGGVGVTTFSFSSSKFQIKVT